MTSLTNCNEQTNALMLRPEDVLYACVAYTRPETRTLNQIIALRSSGKLSINTSFHNAAATIASLPPEVLLRVRTELQAELVRTVALETAIGLDEYEAALVDGLCSDCFWWNHDIYGEDVWAWVENGYREACKCCVTDAADDMTVVSAEKARIARKYAGLEIYSRRQWLDAYIARTYLPPCSEAQPWRGLVKDVLAELGCECSAEREEAYDPTLGPAFTSRYIERKRALQYSFGPSVTIATLRNDNPARRADDNPAVTLNRVLRELQVRPPTDGDDSYPYPHLESSSLRFAHKLQNKLCKPSEHYFRIEWHPSCNCMDCLLNLYPRAPRSNANVRARGTHAEVNSGMLAPVSRVLKEVGEGSTALLSSGFTCALSICALLLHRMLSAPPAAFA